MVMFSSSKKIISKYRIICLSRKNSYKKICYPCDSIFKKEFWRKNYFFKRKPVKMGIKFNLGTNGGPTSKSKKMKSLFMGVCEYQ